ncbi:MAG TPA: amino acid adenylation domain-containing protein [Candidatus Angelobacter sp.]|nr:amino acid adenylation domain-containing protein [Candidatus Angelobacter sp.]
MTQRKTNARVPLSCLQEQLWLHDQLTLESLAYNIRFSYRLKGPLNEEALNGSITEIVRRHEALRAFYPLVEGGPVQSFVEAAPIHIPIEQIKAGTPSEMEAEAKAKNVIAEKFNRPFDLRQGPLYRFLLVRLSGNDHILAFAFHHIIFDGWSSEIFLRELSEAYDHLLAGSSFAFPDLALQYGDFAVWQREWLQLNGIEKQLSFWKDRLAGAPHFLDIRTDKPRPSAITDDGRFESAMLPAALSQAVRDLARQEGVSLFVLFMAAYAVLISRYCGQDDILIGSPIVGRTQKDVANVIGLFANMVVFRTDLGGKPTFRQLLRQVHQMNIDALSNQDVPFERVVHALQPERTLGNTPIVQSVFDLQAQSDSALRLRGLDCTPFVVLRQTAVFDLHLTVVDAAPVFRATMSYRTDLFEPATVARMIKHYIFLLEHIVRQADARVTELQLDEAASRCKTDSGESLASNSVLTQFKSQVRRNPEKQALILGGQSLTYGELNACSDHIADQLRSLGVGSEWAVGVNVQRSMNMVIALLGILKAGGIFVPLDAGYPNERLAFMAQDAALKAVLTDRCESHTCLDSKQTIAMEVASLMNRVSGLRSDREDYQPDPEQAAYIIYTSGSTGEPKGVVIPHGVLATHALQISKHFRIEPTDRILQFASMSFDVFLEQVCASLISGATLVIRGEGTPSSSELLSLIHAHKITVVNLPTAYWSQVARDWAGTPPGAQTQQLKLMIVGGEAMTVEALEAWQRTMFNSVPLLNAYGPTEATITATTFAISGKLDRKIPIGLPVGSRTVYILDRAGNLVPQGVVGELCIGGPLLARGYLNRPELTAGKFVPDPFSERPGVRMYRTGDKARLNEDGVIEFIGRVDHQLKVRGFRIEPGEIESIFNRHPEIETTVVVAREDGSGHKKLVAYVQACQGSSLTEASLRSFAELHLPAYMTPSALVILDRFPYSLNGKLDYRALPAPKESAGADEPQTPVERTLCNIWAQVLGIPKVGIQDNFFALGGDSIMAIQIIARAAKSRIRIMAREFYQNQTVAAQARLADSNAILIDNQDEVAGSVPLTPTQSFYFENGPVDPHDFNQSFQFEIPVGTSPSAMEQAFRELMRHHDALRMKFLCTQGEWRQVNGAYDHTADFSYLDLSDLKADDQQQEIEKIALQMQAGIDLESGRLLRAVQFGLGKDNPGRLFIAVQHLVVDAVSWHILLEDLQHVYEQILANQTIQIGSKTTSFKRWSEELQQYGSSAQVHSEIEFWQRQVHSPTLLPVDYNTETNLVADQLAIRKSLSPEDTSSFLRAAAEAPGSRADVPLLAALGRTLCPWSESTRLLVHVEWHGRESIIDNIDLSRTVGWFTSIFPLQLTHDSTDLPADSLKKAGQLVAAVPDGGIGYGVLRFGGSPECLKLLQSADPQICFNYLGRFDQTTSGASLFRRQGALGRPRSPRAQRKYLFDINAAVLNGKLCIDWAYNHKLHRKETVMELINRYFDELKQHLQANSLGARDRFEKGPSTVKVTQRELAKVLNRLGK